MEDNYGKPPPDLNSSKWLYLVNNSIDAPTVELWQTVMDNLPQI